MLEKFYVSKVRVKLLKLFLSNPEKSYHVRGLTRILDEEINAVRRELERMSKVKFVKPERRGNKLFYTVQKNHIFFNDFLSLVYKEYGLGREIIKHKSKIGEISFAWLTNFFTKHIQKGPQDVDLVIIGDNVNLDFLAKHVKSTEAEVKRQINYTVMSLHEFQIRKERKDPFVMNLLLSSRVMLVGDEDNMLSQNG